MNFRERAVFLLVLKFEFNEIEGWDTLCVCPDNQVGAVLLIWNL